MNFRKFPRHFYDDEISEMTHFLELADCQMFPGKKLKLKGVHESLPTA